MKKILKILLIVDACVAVVFFIWTCDYGNIKGDTFFKRFYF